MKTCFGYVRVSTHKQGEGVSLEAQREAITLFAARNEIEIAGWFEEKETAAKSGRPIFNEMVTELKRGRAGGMIIHRIDRSSRNLKDWATISDLSDAGIDVHFATESLDFRSRGGRLTADIQAVIAADYIRNLQIETRKGVEGRLKQGLYPFPAPLGYINNGGGKAKTLDPVRAPLVRQLFKNYLTGDHSIRSLHHEMVRVGLTSKSGRPISKRTVENVLQNPFYCGLMRNGRSGELFPGVHETLITAREFERIADIKAGRYVKKRSRHDYALRRMFNCGSCDVVLTPERQKSHVYYRCHTPGCPTNTAREERLNEAIINRLLELELTSDRHQILEARYQKWRAHHGFDNELKSVELRLSETQARLERLTDLFIDGKLPQSLHDERRERLQIDLQRLKDERQTIESWSLSDAERAKFFELMKSLAGLYISMNHQERRSLVEICFSNRRWTGKNAILEPSDLILEAQNGLCVPYGGPIRDTLRTFNICGCPL